MLRLIKADHASAGKPNPRNGTPRRFLNFRALNALLHQGSHFGFQIVAHEIEFVDTILIGRVECSFCRRQGEDQPAVTRINGFEAEDVAEKCAVRLGVLTVDNYVSARNHLPLLRNARNRWQVACPVESGKLNRDQIRTIPEKRGGIKLVPQPAIIASLRVSEVSTVGGVHEQNQGCSRMWIGVVPSLERLPRW